MGIKYSEPYLVLKYRDSMHRYICSKMEFLYITSLGATYRYAVKIEQKLKQKMQKFGLGNPSDKNPRKGSPNLHNKGKSKDGPSQDIQSRPLENKDTGKTKKDTGKWCDFYKSP
jgi:hypothetical protein